MKVTGDVSTLPECHYVEVLPLPIDDSFVSPLKAVAAAKERYSLEDGDVDWEIGVVHGLVRSMPDWPELAAWIVVARVDIGSEGPAPIIYDSACLVVDAHTGHFAFLYPGGLQQTEHESWKTTVWRYRIRDGVRDRLIVLYTVRVLYVRDHLMWGSHVARNPPREEFEVTVDGEWPDPSGYRRYGSHEEALQAGRDYIARVSGGSQYP